MPYGAEIGDCTDVIMLYECKVGATQVAGSAPPVSLLHFAERGPLCFSELYWRGTQDRVVTWVRH